MPTSSPLAPVSPGAESISGLFIITLIVAAVILAIVTGAVLYVMIKYRSRGGKEEPKQIFGHRNLEITWTVVPGIILLFLFVLTLVTMRKSDPPVDSSEQPDLVVVAHQWWWELRYPKLGVIAANEIHLPVGKKQLMRIESADVIHSFWVPQVARKVDAIPGHPNHLTVRVDQPGTYLGTCSEYCGAQHAWMRIRLIVQPEAEFNAWVRQHRNPPPIMSGDALRGEQLFAGLTCINCHAVENIGPNLDHIASRETIGAGVLKNTPGNLAKWLRNPQAVKPGSNMPNMKLSEDQIQNLVAYLEELK